MPRTIWVANGKGGVGKSVLMMALAAFYEGVGRPLRLIDVDDQPKLAAFVGEDKVLSLNVGASPEALRRDPSQAYGHWDRLATEILKGDSGVDIGANMDRRVLQWAEKSELAALFEEAGVEMDVFVPVTAEPLSVTSGVGLLQEIGRIFPRARRILVLNEAAGTFESYVGTSVFRTIGALRREGVFVVEMEQCRSAAWSEFERLKLSPARVVTMKAQQLARRTGMGLLAVRRAVGDYANWLLRLHDRLAPVL